MTDATAPGASDARCPICSEPHEPDQEYCLECGSRLPAAPSMRIETPLWAWGAVVALAMVAIVSGIVVALLASSDDGEIALAVEIPVTSTLPVLPAAPPAPEPPPTPVEPAVTVPIEGTEVPAPVPDPGTIPEPPLSAEDLLPGGAPEPVAPGDDPLGLGDSDEPNLGDALDDPGTDDLGTIEPTFPPPPPADSLGGWPAGTDGYTIILASIPESRGRATADSRAARARAAGLDEVGVLFSSSFSSLRAGYWVTFTGVYGTLNAARAELATARAAGFPTAYTRRVAS